MTPFKSNMYTPRRNGLGKLPAVGFGFVGVFVQFQGCNLYIYIKIYLYVIVVEPKRCISTACSELVNSPKDFLEFLKNITCQDCTCLL